MNDIRRVVVVGGLPETADVLKAVLEPRGWEVARFRGEHRAGLESNRPPSLVVLHRDDEPRPLSMQNGPWADVPTVLIGSAEFPEADSPASDGRPFLSQPFHYAELIQAVDRLLPSPPRAA